MKFTYTATIRSCFLGYIVQAIINNFAPLLFLMFQKQFQIPLSQITFLITINFLLQLLVDLVCIRFVDKVGYRIPAVVAHFLCAAGLFLLPILPAILPSPFVGLLLSVSIYAIGGGLLEVLISPITEACPTKNKEKAMSILHSFYCWGHVLVILLSTAFFALFGIESWAFLAFFWALFPFINAFLFLKVPLASLLKEDQKGLSISNLLRNKVFWIFFILMLCAGASEQSISQWASVFAEQNLGVSKAIGDLAGPLLFASTMGLSRLLFGKFSHKISLHSFMFVSCVLCIASYLLLGLTRASIFGFIGCALCGFSVGILWPGLFSTASKTIPLGGTALFALLALGGDLGCSFGPTLVGFVSSSFQENLQIGFLFAILFPTILCLYFLFQQFKKRKRK